MNILIERTIELNAPLLTEPLPGSLFTTENKAHQFLIACTQSGLPVTLSGTVSAKFIREANNTTILMSGSISGGKASLILPADCYNISGRFDLTIFVTSNNVTTCIYSATGSVKAAQDGTLVDEGTVVPSIEQLQQDVTNLQINKVSKSGDTMTGDLTVVADAYIKSNGNGNPALFFMNSAANGSGRLGLILTSRDAHRTELREYWQANNTNYFDSFQFPAPDTTKQENRYYDILTTKDHPAFSKADIDWTSSQYVIGNYEVRVEKSLDTVRFQGLFNLTGLTANTSVSIGTIPSGYRPRSGLVERTIGFSMTPNWNAPQNIGATFVLVSVYSDGTVFITPGATVINGGFWIDMTWCI